MIYLHVYDLIYNVLIQIFFIFFFSGKNSYQIQVKVTILK